MTCTKIKVISENKLDYKYQRITENIVDLEYKYLDYRSFMGLLFENLFQNKFPNSRVCFHIRYLKWRGYFFTIPIYVVLISLCKINGIRIFWTCHNIYEHKFKSRIINDFLRWFIFSVSDKVIVLHEKVGNWLPDYSKKKIYVATFGDFRPHFQNLKKTNASFKEKYYRWLDERDIEYPDAIYISTNQKTSLIHQLAKKDSDHNYLIIDPTVSFRSSAENVFLYSEKFIHSEVHEILSKGQPIGIVAIDNISVPTSIYMYASYNIPVLGFNREPVNTIITNYSIGLVFEEKESLFEKIELIKKQYSYFSLETKNFLEVNNWRSSGLIHEKVFCSN